MTTRPGGFHRPLCFTLARLNPFKDVFLYQIFLFCCVIDCQRRSVSSQCRCGGNRDVQRHGQTIRASPLSCRLLILFQSVTAWITVEYCASPSLGLLLRFHLKNVLSQRSSESLWLALRCNDEACSHDVWCHMNIQSVKKDCQPLSRRGVWPQPHWCSLEWATRCLQSFIHLCKPAITGIIGLATCTAHCGLDCPQWCGGSVAGVYIRSSRWLMELFICCTLHVCAPVIHPKNIHINPLPQSSC